MDSLKSALNFLRNLFSDTPLENSRKRRATDILEPYSIPRKTLKFSPMAKSFEDEWSFKRRHPIRRVSRLLPNETIVLDDDEIDSENKRPQSKFNRFTSTPTVKNDDDDVKFVKETKFPSLMHKPLFNIDLTTENGGFKKIKTSPIADIDLTADKNGTKYNKSQNSRYLTPSLDYSFRLDDKMQYKKLLDSAGSHLNDSSFYQTPIGKYLGEVSMPSSRTSRILSMAKRTSSENSRNDGKLSTKDCIIKVLDEFDSEPVTLESDSDSDVVFVPIEPKPDIKVDPINTLKTIVDTNKHTKVDWIKDIVEKHQRSIAEYKRDAKEYTETANKQNKINRDIRMGVLLNKINKSLTIKDVILPVEEVKEDAELPPLTDEQLKLVQIAFSKSDPNEVLASKFNQNITRRNLYTLSGLQWLNDEVINFYMNLIIERGKDSKWPKTYCMNTFFYPKLLKDGPQSLRRWTKKVDIFAHDLICVPIHLGMHWCMAIIDLRSRSIKYYDSMGSPNNKCLNALKNYLSAEHLDKKKTDYDTSDFLLENVKDIPQQMNGSDCGMFACTFAEFLSRDAKITFEQKDMPYLRKKMVVEIMTGCLLIQ